MLESGNHNMYGNIFKYIFLDKVGGESISFLRISSAEVAELVDALGSGSSGRTPVRVRVSASAPY